MKKQSQNEGDIVALLTKIQEKVAGLEKKVDVLLNRPSPRPLETRPSPQPSSANVIHAHPDIASGARLDAPHKGRPMYKAVCADCKKDCEIPFQPSGDRPVYCKECFSRRKASRALNAAAGQKPLALPVPAVIPASVDVKAAPAKTKKKPAAAKKAVAKKKPVPKKKK